MKLHIDDNDLASCVSCGLCLPHCPTFRATGEEALSPRGRITAMRAVHDAGAEADDEFVHFMETCVQCRGCEPACPSGVKFGALMEGTRRTLADRRAITPRWQRAGFALLGHHRLLLAGSTLLAVSQRLRLMPKRLQRRLGIGPLAIRRGAAPRATGNDAWLYVGCVMDAWMRPTHRATADVLDAIHVTHRPAGRGGGCCGALHIHAGLHREASALAIKVMASMPGDAPIIVNSAGCGAAMKDYGHVLGTPEAEAFAARVRDVNEFIADRVDLLPPLVPQGPVVVQDPCHLRHVQRSHSSVRTVLEGCADLVELDDDGLCCGAGGAYSALQPELAGQIRDRKSASIARATGDGQRVVIASANPGCAMHLANAGHDVRHPMDILAAAIRETS